VHLMRVILTQSSGIFFSVFILAGTASAQVSLTSPASAELVGANISMPGTGYPAGAISANWVSITVTQRQHPDAHFQTASGALGESAIHSRRLCFRADDELRSIYDFGVREHHR